MATTTQMSKKLVEELKLDISKLLGRGRKAFPCPLGPYDLANLWHNMLPPDTVAAYTLLKDRELNTNSLCAPSIKFRTELDSGSYELQFVNHGDDIFLCLPKEVSPHRGRHFMQVAFPRNAEVYNAFVQWMENMAVIERDFPPALDTLNEILKFIGGTEEAGSRGRTTWIGKGTVGQLVRAIPDLHKYLPRDRQELLSQQSRSSNMPYEWAAFDRDRIEHLQVVMAKASLLPAQHRSWHDIFETGAHFV